MCSINLCYTQALNHVACKGDLEFLTGRLKKNMKKNINVILSNHTATTQNTQAIA